MKVAIGSDHKGFKLKVEAVNYLDMWGVEIIDVGTTTDEECDYPKYAYLVANAVANGDAKRGILISDNGIGMAIVANKITGVRAACCQTWKEAQESCERFGTNVLCVGEDVDMWQILDSWLHSEFMEENKPQFDLISQVESHLKAR